MIVFKINPFINAKWEKQYIYPGYNDLVDSVVIKGFPIRLVKYFRLMEKPYDPVYYLNMIYKNEHGLFRGRETEPFDYLSLRILSEKLEKDEILEKFVHSYLKLRSKFV